ncbi:MAG: CRISPR-associated endonuclease Cas1, partial [Burkholderiales bacterium]|nr:CRISPR-associated endonuclease Cas1 [Phycisphaerae bacterium]
EYAYCPRLFHFMHVEGRFEDNQFTVEGRTAHRRVDQMDHVLPDADDASPADQNPELFPKDNDEPPNIARSVPLGSETLGITAKLDLVSTDSDQAVPVETKRGRVPDNAERSWEPERVQLMAQGLLLRESGYQCDRGVLYFASSRTRVTIPFTPELEIRTRELIAEARLATDSTVLPEPLEDSPKCRHCSLVGICLPDETLALKHAPAAPDVELTVDGQPVRRLYPVRDDATPLYVQEPGAKVGTSRGNIVITKDNVKLASARLQDVSQLVLCGNISISAQAIHILAEASISIAHLSGGHWFYAVTHGQHLRNAFDRAAQFEAARDPARCLQIARQIVIDKAVNQRTLLRRNAASDIEVDRALREMDHYSAGGADATTIDSLRGFEGSIAARYFSQFSKLLKPKDFDATWDFTHRNRRPPTDPVNALLSFGYAMLAKEMTIALLIEGLDPYWGFYHQPRHGRPALALDLMEPFRAAVVDSAVITAINTGMVSARDFQTTRSGCIMQPAGRKAFIRAYEARLDQLITHPVFNYRCSWRIVLRLQARLLSRWLRGDIATFTSVTTR